MKAKTLGLMTLCILSMVLVIGFGSAALILNPSSVDKSVLAETSSVSFDFNLNNTNPVESYTNIVWTGTSNNDDVTFTLPSLTTLENKSNQNLTFKVNNIHSNFVGTITGEINVVSGTTSEILSFTINVEAPTEIEECSTTGNPGELDIKDIKFTNNGFGEKNDEWVPLDEIEVEIEIENDGDYDVDDIVLEWGLYDINNKLWIIELDEIDEFNLKEGDEELFSISFKIDDDLEVDLDELEDGENYRFYVVATGTIDDSASPNDEDETCVFSSEPASIEIDHDFLILNNFQIEGIDLEDMEYPGALSCGSTLQLTADIWNIGDSNQEDIELRIYNYDLGIDEVLEIGDVDSFDSESISFEFTIPEGMEEGWTTLEFTIQEDGDVFENDYVDKDAEFEILFNLENCALPKAFVSASLDEGGKAGKELIVRSTITNTGTKATTYLINAHGYSEWASSAVVEPSTLILEAGQSADVLITLKVNRDASGERLFNINVVSEGELVVSQPLSVSIEKALLGDLFNEDNGLITALIIGIALILVIIIVVLTIRVARR